MVEDQLIEHLANEDLDPIPAYLFYRNLLKKQPHELEEVRNRFATSKWVDMLESSQWDDGSWGRFHTQDTKIKQPFPTTECAIRCALGSGLDKAYPVLAKVVGYIERVLRDDLDWRDWHEKHDNPDAWAWSVKHISAANLAAIDPEHALLAPHRDFWAKMAHVTFGSGRYDRKAEIETFNDMTGYGLKEPPRIIHRYALFILSGLSNNFEDLIEPIGQSILSEWPAPEIQNGKEISSSPEAGRSLFYWLASMEPAYGLPPVNKAVISVLKKTLGDGTELIDLGTKLPRWPQAPFPLSEGWRKKGTRQKDSTIWLLTQLSRVRS